MRRFGLMKTSAIALAVAAAGIAANAQETDAGTTPDDGAQSSRTLDTVVITSQRRESSLQDAAVAVSAVTGESLEKDRVLSYSDLARSISSLSYTENSPLDQEFNIRGITNTRLDSPSADQSIGIFIDDVYVGRSGLLNSDFFDVERVEVVRGPQGVLLGRNVVGGAISIYTAKPEEEFGGAFNAEFGNYDSRLFNGHVTGTIAQDVTARLSFQSRQHDGYNKDLTNNRDLDNLDSFQARAQLMWEPSGADLTVRAVVDYSDDESNGVHRVAIDDPGAPGQGPWSTTRDAISAILPGGLDIRESLPQNYRYSGDNFDQGQELRRESIGFTLDIEKGLGDFATFRSITGYRTAKAFSMYDQTGIGYRNGFGVTPTPLAFSFPVLEDEEIDQLTQEFRLLSTGDGPLNWLVGAYLQEDDVDKFDRYLAEVPLTVLGTLSGESHWINNGETSSRAVFGQVGYEFTDQLRGTVGVRWSQDKKTGSVSGLQIRTGDIYNPTDTVPLSPLITPFNDVAYSQTTEEVTPQATLEWEPNDSVLTYITYSHGYKGGGFEDTPANPAAATTPYDPETVENIELGLKLDLLDGRARLNTAVFNMKYKDLQVTQTDDGCLCNITDNAADAKITGIESELQWVVTDDLLVFGAVTLLETEYEDFVDSNGLDNSGNELQRTPNYQFNVGGEYTSDFMGHTDALTLRLTYSHQGKLYWLPDNFQHEDAYGLLDGRITFAPQDADWSVSLWGKNIADEFYRTNIVAFLGDEVSTLGAPRTYGISLGYKF
ncbi:TonB-dependent receptor [Hyphomonas sp.]|uniref:TonB-dependent receptor n=1 Tax=Hyphomonas sp. TaxID=87 RepID=UPI0025B86612|nr:TonB-dependent receptor [Hyphomonas sp.]